MQYVLITPFDESSYQLPFDFFPPLGKMAARKITWQEPQQKQAEQSSSSWTSTLAKAALFGAAIGAAAYAGYRYGFFDGASGMFDTMKDHFQNAAASNPAPGASLDSEAMSGVEFGRGTYAVARDIGSSQSLSDSVDYEAIKKYFMDKAAKRNPLMNIELPKMPKFEMPFNATKITDSLSEIYYTVKNEALVYLGAGTIATVSTLWSVTKCLGAVRGLYR